MNKVFDGVAVTIAERVMRITLDRPARRNALTRQMLEGLTHVLQRLPEDLRGVTIEGAGGAFSAGADIAELSVIGTSPSPARGAEDVALLAKEVMALIETSPVPVVACVDGPAVGGGLELALACDWIHATTRSTFALPETTLGLIPGFGGIRRLVERAGIALASEMILGGRALDARTAFERGLISYVHDSHESAVVSATCGFTSGRARSRYATALARESLRAAVTESRTAAFEYETKAYGRAFAHADAARGMAAFLSKREADFARESASDQAADLT